MKTNHPNEVVSVPLAGAVSQGAPIDRSVAGEVVQLPRVTIDDREIAFRAATSHLRAFSIERGDILIVELRWDGRAATAELVLATLDERVFVGRWWTKHGQRALVDHASSLITNDARLQVMGAITLVVRLGDDPPSPR